MAILEPLESRVFLSATPAQAEVKVLHKDEGKLAVIVKNVGSALSKDIGMVKSELKHLGVTKTEAAIIVTAVTDEKAVASSLNSDLKFYFPELNKGVSKLISDNKKLAKKPTASLQQQIRVDNAVLGTISIYGNVPFTYGSVAPAFYSALDAIVTANPSDAKLAAEVAAINSAVATVLNTAQTDAGAVYDTDISNAEDLYPY